MLILTRKSPNTSKQCDNHLLRRKLKMFHQLCNMI